jgi:hypothetical protein
MAFGGGVLKLRFAFGGVSRIHKCKVGNESTLDRHLIDLMIENGSHSMNQVNPSFWSLAEVGLLHEVWSNANASISNMRK